MRKKYNRRSRDSRTTPPPPDNDSPNRNPSRRQPIPNKPTAIAQNSPRLDLLTWLTNFVAPVVEHMLPTSCRHCALSSWCHLWPDPSPTLAVHELRESCQNCCAVWEFCHICQFLFPAISVYGRSSHSHFPYQNTLCSLPNPNPNSNPNHKPGRKHSGYCLERFCLDTLSRTRTSIIGGDLLPWERSRSMGSLSFYGIKKTLIPAA